MPWPQYDSSTGALSCLVRALQMRKNLKLHPQAHLSLKKNRKNIRKMAGRVSRIGSPRHESSESHCAPSTAGTWALCFIWHLWQLNCLSLPWRWCLTHPPVLDQNVVFFPPRIGCQELSGSDGTYRDLNVN